MTRLCKSFPIKSKTTYVIMDQYDFVLGMGSFGGKFGSECLGLFLFCFQVCYARILDLKRKFLEAALRYYDISLIEKRKIGDEYVFSCYFSLP